LVPPVAEIFADDAIFFGWVSGTGGAVPRFEPDQSSRRNAMIAHIHRLESAARIAMGDNHHSEPLPPGPNYGPFGYFRLALLIMAALVAIVFVAQLF
jgi:hypothetical protein